MIDATSKNQGSGASSQSLAFPDSGPARSTPPPAQIFMRACHESCGGDRLRKSTLEPPISPYVRQVRRRSGPRHERQVGPHGHAKPAPERAGPAAAAQLGLGLLAQATALPPQEVLLCPGAPDRLPDPGGEGAAGDAGPPAAGGQC
eukprot:scaffold83_cov246-Pinguiococcus_pyrenoidosus.AAC.16